MPSACCPTCSCKSCSCSAVFIHHQTRILRHRQSWNLLLQGHCITNTIGTSFCNHEGSSVPSLAGAAAASPLWGACRRAGLAVRQKEELHHVPSTRKGREAGGNLSCQTLNFLARYLNLSSSISIHDLGWDFSQRFRPSLWSDSGCRGWILALQMLSARKAGAGSLGFLRKRCRRKIHYICLGKVSHMSRDIIT